MVFIEQIIFYNIVLNKDKLILMCATARRDVGKVKQIAKQIDPNCFMVITNSREVVGEGFKVEK